MYKRLLLLSALLGAILCSNRDDRADTILEPPVASTFVAFNASSLPVQAPHGAATLHGHNNYYAAQQIFYVYGPSQWTTSNVTAADRPKLPAGYSVTPGVGVHKLHNRKLTWNRARKVCISEGGHLAIVNSFAEERILYRMLEEQKLATAWLGAHDLFEEGDWVTVQNEPLESTGYSRWTAKISNCPDNAGGNEHCAELTDGGMNDLACASQKPFLCEIDL